MAADDEDVIGPTTIRRASEAMEAAERKHVEKHGRPPDEKKRQSLARRILSLIRSGEKPETIADEAMKEADKK